MDKEELKAYYKQYRLLHKDEIREKDRKRDQKRKEYKAKNNREYREQHRLELKAKKKDYYNAHREEISKQHKEYYNENKAEFREKRVAYLFGISAEEYNNMVERQQNLCAICGNPETSARNGVVKRLAIDHNHKTGKIRKLICFSCNAVIGLSKEDVDTLQKIITYLLEHKE